MPPADPVSPETQAIELMKAGHPPASVHAHLRGQGVSDLDARAIIEKLLVLQSQAAVLDPKRLREEAKWMFMQGAPIEHVLHHWTSLGVKEEHARPELEKLLAEVHRMRPCDRCCTPMAPAESFFDVQGRSICRGCNARDTIGASERRVVEQALEWAGVPAVALNAASGALMPATAQVPWCRGCRLPGVARAALHPRARDQIHPGWSYVCGQCLSGLR